MSEKNQSDVGKLNFSPNHENFYIFDFGIFFNSSPYVKSEC